MALGALAAIVAASLGASKYNVVYFIADDLRPEFLAPYGQDFVSETIHRACERMTPHKPTLHRCSHLLWTCWRKLDSLLRMRIASKRSVDLQGVHIIPAVLVTFGLTDRVVIIAEQVS